MDKRIDDGAAEAIRSHAHLHLRKVLIKRVGLMLDEDFMPVGLASAAPLLTVAEVDKFDYIGVGDIGATHKVRVAADHFFLALVLDAMLVYELFRDGVAISSSIQLDPIANHQARLFLNTVPHPANCPIEF